MRPLLAAILAILTLAPGQALAWGNAGHRMLGRAAMQALPIEVPGFLRTTKATDDVGELAREPDRSRGAGKLHDAMRDPAHFADVEDDGTVRHGPLISTPPTTRSDYDKALVAAGGESWEAGYLPIAIVDQYQQLTQDFAYWRVLTAAEKNPAWRKHRKWFRQDRLRRETQILATIGALGHYVGDGSQPMHVSAHYNGWGDYPNPNGYTTAKIHGPFEGDFVLANVDPAKVSAQMAPLKSCGCPVEKRVADYLTATWKQVEPLYALEKAGGLNPENTALLAFTTGQLATGASEMRDLVLEAWRASAQSKIGWKPVKVSDVLAGTVDPYPALLGVD
jgi:hypothetical protein